MNRILCNGKILSLINIVKFEVGERPVQRRQKALSRQFDRCHKNDQTYWSKSKHAAYAQFFSVIFAHTCL